jgi:hypothetical protein
MGLPGHSKLDHENVFWLDTHADDLIIMILHG